MTRTRVFLLALTTVIATSFSLPACKSKAKKDPPGTLNLAIIAKVKGMDPAFGDDQYSGTEIGRVYEGLVQYHYLKRPPVLVPNLAEALPEVSKDGLTYTFRLKKGVLFH